MKLYQEEDDSTFTHYGKEYSLNILFKETANNPISTIEFDKVKWILNGTHLDSERVKRTDVNVPILVIYNPEEKLWIVLDGTHRVKRAEQLKKKELPCKIVKEEQLVKALIIKFFHVSFDDYKEGIWHPQIPAGSDIGEKTSLSEPDIPRISFSETLEGCFRAIYPNVSQYFEEKKFPWMEFYVYTPVLTAKTKIIPQKELTKKHLVHDAHITGEIWILSSVAVEKVAKIKVLNTISKGDLTYRPFNEHKFERRFHSPKVIEIEIMEDYKNIKLPVYEKW